MKNSILEGDLTNPKSEPQLEIENVELEKKESPKLPFSEFNMKYLKLSSVFRSRKELDEYEDALQMASEFSELVDPNTQESDTPLFLQKTENASQKPSNLSKEESIQQVISRVTEFLKADQYFSRLDVICIDDDESEDNMDNSNELKEKKKKSSKSSKKRPKKSPKKKKKVSIIDIEDKSEDLIEITDETQANNDVNCNLNEENMKLEGDDEITFLIRFRPGWVYACILTVGISYLEKLKRYNETIGLLHLLLKLPYCPYRRGHWWQRLLVNYGHLKKKSVPTKYAKHALADPYLAPHEMLTLERKFFSLCNKASKMSLIDIEFKYLDKLSLAKEIWIRGRPFKGIAGKKSVFVGYNGSRCGVEELCLQFYKCKYQMEGLHCEGSILFTLFGLLFWEIIYDASVPLVFQTPYQNAPLDFCTEMFYKSRKKRIDERIDLIAQSVNCDDENDNALKILLIRSWESYFGQIGRCVNWGLDIETLVTVADCIGGAVLSQIMLTFAKGYQHSSSGLPDLILWNKTLKTSIFSEVKGPSDKLSDKQSIWLDILCNASKLSNTPDKVQIHIAHVSSKDDITYDDEDLEFDDNPIANYSDRFVGNDTLEDGDA